MNPWGLPRWTLTILLFGWSLWARVGAGKTILGLTGVVAAVMVVVAACDSVPT